MAFYYSKTPSPREVVEIYRQNLLNKRFLFNLGRFTTFSVRFRSKYITAYL